MQRFNTLTCLKTKNVMFSLLLTNKQLPKQGVNGSELQKSYSLTEYGQHSYKKTRKKLPVVLRLIYQ